MHEHSNSSSGGGEPFIVWVRCTIRDSNYHFYIKKKNSQFKWELFNGLISLFGVYYDFEFNSCRYYIRFIWARYTWIKCLNFFCYKKWIICYFLETRHQLLNNQKQGKQKCLKGRFFLEWKVEDGLTICFFLFDFEEWKIWLLNANNI